MAISLSEPMSLTCAACATRFNSDVWTIVDAGEQPALAQALLDGQLDMAICPSCGSSNQAQVALLYHDASQRRVHFAVPAGADEFRWRERAQELLRQLVSQIPEDAQLAYLGDVQVNQEIDGVRRALTRRQRARTPGAKPSFGKPIPMPESLANMPPLKPRSVAAPAASRQPPAASLSAEVEQLLAVSSVEALQALVLHSPQLMSSDADEYLRQLADEAFNQGDRDTATAIHEARSSLADLRAGREVGAKNAALEPSVEGDAGQDVVVQELPEPAYQALLHTASDPALMDAIRLFPVLLEPWSDDAIGERIEAALAEDNERLATVIEERRDALAALRAMLLDNDALGSAMYALLAATDTDAVERVLIEHPSLLTSVAQQALAMYGEAAQQRGDDRAAALAAERRSMLQQVRVGVNH